MHLTQCSLVLPLFFFSICSFLFLLLLFLGLLLIRLLCFLLLFSSSFLRLVFFLFLSSSSSSFLLFFGKLSIWRETQTYLPCCVIGTSASECFGVDALQLQLHQRFDNALIMRDRERKQLLCSC